MSANSDPFSAGCEPINSLAGDLNGDNSVAFDDFLVLSANFGQETESYSDGDIDCNGTVAFADFLALSANFGGTIETQAVPEPTARTMVLPLVLLACVRRRRNI